MAITLAVTGSMVWTTALAMAWLFSRALQQSLNYNSDAGPIYYMVERFHLRMVSGGLAWPLFGFPLAAVVLAFFLLRRRRWPRIVFTALGAVSLLVTTVMMRGDVSVMWPAIVYIAVCCLLLWIPSVTRWNAPTPDPPGSPSETALSGDGLSGAQ